jgi:hypothetical protein
VAGFGWHAGRCRDRAGVDRQARCAGGLLYSAFWLALLLVCLLLDATGDKLVLKKYCHIAFAAETPIGLLTPVVRDVDQKDIFETANAIHALAQKAKAGRLALSDAEGACFTVSNLGALGGTGFIPVINAPEEIATLQIPLFHPGTPATCQGQP